MELTPVLQIVHISDRHVVDPNHHPPVALLQKLGRLIRRAYPRLHQSYQDGLAPNDPDAPQRFEDFYVSQTSQHPMWCNVTSWLVDTGDSTTFGDNQSFQRARRQFQRLATHVNQAVEIYGNHDAWPGRPPKLTDNANIGAGQKSLLTTHNYVIGQAAASAVLATPGARIQLFTLDTVAHDPASNFLARGFVAPPQLSNLGALIDSRNQDSTQPSLRILACHHPVHYPNRPVLPYMRIGNDRQVGRELDSPTPSSVRPHVHIVLGGHTHTLHPELGKLPPSAPLCVHPQLGDHQCQLNIGSLAQIDRYGKRGLWPNQAQFLRFYTTPDPGLIVLSRQVAGRRPGVKPAFEFVEVDPVNRPGLFEERLALAI